MDDSFKNEVLFKILVIGDFGVGKTSIIRRYAEGTFSPKYKITIGADFAIKRLDWDEDLRINLQLWDIAGHERFGSLTSVYYRYAVGAAIVFDLTRPETFESVTKWLNDLKDKISLPKGQNLPVILLANKADITTGSLPQDLTMFCKQHNIKCWHLTSAKENINIAKAMNILVQSALENYHNNGHIDSDAVKIHEDQTKNNKKRCSQCSR
ncbi:ras-related protein Rab-32-like [Onthophagus taurus]|uniref:ras-related protein Rab-32-like n=1 Tax=Onthophagus taurus TaxID=166361 RepID=UPI000C20C3FF|nr:ras-related protein Rab-32-like [Onthophagus taurus]